MYADPRVDPRQFDRTFKISQNGTRFSNLAGQPFNSSRELLQWLPNWGTYEPEVILECALSAIVDMVRLKTRATVRTVQLCTEWSKRRGTPELVLSCISNEADISYDIFHPLKLSQGLDVWGEMFDRVNGNGKQRQFFVSGSRETK
jgi:hypothetical protein